MVELLSVGDLDQMPARQWVVPGLVPDDGLVCLYGAPGTGKTFVALDMAMSVACGCSHWHGRPLPSHGTAAGVVYVAAEGIRGMRSRVATWFSNADAATAAEAANISFVSHAVNLSSEDQATSFADTLVRHQHAANTPVRLVIFDTLARCAVGADENSSQEMGVVVDHLDRIRRRISASSGAGCTAMVVHHSGKSAPAVMRGSSAVLGAMDTAIALLAVGNGGVELRVTKQKEGPEDGVSLCLVETMGSMVVTSVPALPPQKRARS